MMAAPYRKNSMMAMLDAKPAAKGGKGQNNGQQFWNDESADDQLTPLRKHLISTYLQVSDEDAMPLLSEYFGVALSFVALGALLRSSNSSKKNHKKGILSPEEERLDLQGCSRFERMALESMLKESMERLGGLSQNAYQLECRVRDLVDENVTRDREKVHLLKTVAEGDKVVQELKALRRAEGRANERVMSIVAAKEQDWLKEKRNLQKEVEKLKETVNGMTREAKFQARRCRNPTCEHCKGIEKVVKTVKGRISLRELHSSRESAQANGRREAPKLGHPVENPEVERLEIEEDRVLMKAIELKKKQKEHQSKVERMHQSVDSAESSSSQSPSKELLLRQQQDMESELANILKRVGMLKQKSYLTAGTTTSKVTLVTTEDMHLPVDNNGALEHPKGEISFQEGENTEKEPLITGEPNMDDPTFEVADCTSDQEQSGLVELGKAFEWKDDDDETFSPPQHNRVETDNGAESSSSPPQENHLVTDNAAENGKAQPELQELVKDEISGTTNERQRALVTDDELVQLQEMLSLEDGLVSFPELGNESSENLEEDTGKSEAVISDAIADTIGEGETSTPVQALKEADAQEQEFTPEAATNVLQTDNGVDRSGLQSDRSQDGSRPDSECSSVAETSGNASAESSNEDEQVVGVVEDEDTPEFADALSCPLDPITFLASEEKLSSFVSEQPEHDHTEYDTGVDVNEKWGFEDPVSSSTENQDIPVFERNDVEDDLAGELPEPEEKRVCGLETTNELPSTVKDTSLQEGCEHLTDKDDANIEGVVGSEQEEDPFVEKIGFVADEKPKSDAVVEQSQGHKQADVILPPNSSQG